MYIILYPGGYYLSRGEKQKRQLFFAVFFENVVLLHICKALDRLGEALNGLIRVAVLDAVLDAMLDVSLEHYLAAAVERRPCRIDLRENVLAWNIFIHHPVYRLNLPDDFFEPAVQVLGIHTLFHFITSIPLGVYVNYNTRSRRCQDKTPSGGAFEFIYPFHISGKF